MRGEVDLLPDQFSRMTFGLGRENAQGTEFEGRSARATQTKKSSRPTMPCDGPRMNPSVDVGNPPRPFRHLRMTERRTPDPSSSQVPVHSALVQKSVTAITNLAGRLSGWMVGKSPRMRKR